MRFFKLGGIEILLTFLWFAPLCRADQPDRPPTAPAPGSIPRLTGVFPPGARAGTSIRCRFVGHDLRTVKRIEATGQGVEVVAIEPESSEALAATIRASANAALGFRELRVESSTGLSNPLMFRIDALSQVVEREPNDEPRQASELPRGSAAVGTLRPLDLDHFRFPGEAGKTFTIDLEARRLGTPISPVITLFSASGAALRQVRETRGVDGDCRFLWTCPADGDYVIQVRDNLYGGGPSAAYRLRIDDAPFATGIDPLGGPAAQRLVATAVGGNLKEPVRLLMNLPDNPGALLEVDPIRAPQWNIIGARRLDVGFGVEVAESSSTAVPLGATINGRISRAGEVDRYSVVVRKRDQVRVQVRAACLGSWLDSVVVLRDSQGRKLGENDDARDLYDGGASGPSSTASRNSPDSRLDHEAKADGTLWVEITDRFGEGGPEYAYRLSVAPPRDDFAATAYLVAAEVKDDLSEPPLDGTDTGGEQYPGSLNLVAGTTQAIRVQVSFDGDPGPFTVRVTGLPAGVSADELTLRPVPARRRFPAAVARVSGSLLLRADPAAGPGSGQVRVEVEGTVANGRKATRTAVFPVVLSAGETTPRGRPVFRDASSLPARVVGRRNARP
jgi:hypothetical protein